MKSPDADCRDAELIRQIQTGDPEEAATAFDEFAKLHWDGLFKYLASTGLTSDEQKDAFSKTWERVYQKIGQYQYREGCVFAWIRTIAHYVVLEDFRYSRRYQRLPVDQDWNDLGGDIADPNTPELEVFQSLTREQLRVIVQPVLAEAPEDYRLYIEAEFELEFSAEEIQELYNWSQSKVYTTKFRALQWLKRNFLKRYTMDEIQTWLA